MYATAGIINASSHKRRTRNNQPGQSGWIDNDDDHFACCFFHINEAFLSAFTRSVRSLFVGFPRALAFTFQKAIWSKFTCRTVEHTARRLHHFGHSSMI